MGFKPADHTGETFGRLTALYRCGKNKSNHALWVCRCSCGKEVIVSTDSLAHNTKSCGCLNDEVRKSGNNGRKHGGAGTRLHRIWKAMKNRCYNENSRDFKDYGAKGVCMCDEWKCDFPAFRDWALANGYTDNLSIDRINAAKNYSPDNCRWATTTTQANNKRTTIKAEINGESRTITEWAIVAGLPRSTVHTRYYKGVRGAELIAPPKKTKRS